MFIFRIIASIINLAINIAIWLLGIRFLLKIFGANAEVPITAWIYANTETLLLPFEGILKTRDFEGNSVFESNTVFAILIYLLLGYLFHQIIVDIKRSILRRKFKKQQGLK